MSDRYGIIQGCLLGLAVGDAMGYTVDNRSLSDICSDYGPNGLLGYDLVNGYADITSYTQLAAFSANGLLMGLTRSQLQGRRAPLIRYVNLAIREWSRSQHYCQQERNYCWLSGIPEAKRRRCMDTWMLDTLSKPDYGTMDAPTSFSNHPAALTTVVPIALLSDQLDLTQEDINQMSAEAVALTHGHAEAFLSGAVFAYALCQIVQGTDLSPVELAKETMNAIQLQFGRRYPQTTTIWELLQLALTLAENENCTQMEAMERLGCRTAAEVLAGALYACITCHGDFDAAMITAVNHSGRSAAVGAITGAILGAKFGYSALPEFYLESLEPAEVLMELANDIAQGCPMDMDSNLFDDDWDRKYIHAGK